jgi:hypothetical protein
MCKVQLAHQSAALLIVVARRPAALPRLPTITPSILPCSYAAIKFASYLFRFQPKRCYAPNARPCKALNKTYLRLDPAPKPWPPAVLAPGEYTTHIIGIVKNGQRVHILTQLLGVGQQ